jgi:DNA repair exonuclease SbcCD ATPase subunit
LTADPASVPGSDLESERIEALEEELQELREDLEAERFAVGVHNAKVATLQKALSRRGSEAAKLSAMQEATQLRGRLQDVEQRLAESVAQHAALARQMEEAEPVQSDVHAAHPTLDAAVVNLSSSSQSQQVLVMLRAAQDELAAISSSSSGGGGGGGGGASAQATRWEQAVGWMAERYRDQQGAAIGAHFTHRPTAAAAAAAAAAGGVMGASAGGDQLDALSQALSAAISCVQGGGTSGEVGEVDRPAEGGRGTDPPSPGSSSGALHHTAEAQLHAMQESQSRTLEELGAERQLREACEAELTQLRSQLAGAGAAAAADSSAEADYKRSQKQAKQLKKAKKQLLEARAAAEAELSSAHHASAEAARGYEQAMQAERASADATRAELAAMRDALERLREDSSGERC